jgi:hypothetical protein
LQFEWLLLGAVADRSAPFLNNLIKSVIGHTEGLTARLGFEIGILILPLFHGHLDKRVNIVI